MSSISVSFFALSLPYLSYPSISFLIKLSKIFLSGNGMVEFANFQINQDVAFQNTMIENQINALSRLLIYDICIVKCAATQ